jgi:hypothetical protein
MSTDKQSSGKEPSKSKKNSVEKTSAERAVTGSFRQTGMHDSSYKVRGGGFTPSQSPAARITSLATIVVGIVLVFYMGWRLIGCLNNYEETKVVTININESHEAYNGLPFLLDHLWQGPDDAFDQMREAGLNIYINDRNSTDNPDRSSNGKELVCFPVAGNEEDFAAYNAAEFSSFSHEDMQDRLLGSWMMDLSSGEAGLFAQLKYVNMATSGIFEEMHWALEKQGLIGEGTTIVFEGEDRFGNSVICGYTVFENDVTVYWQAISCTYEARYKGSDTRSLPDTAVFIKLRVGTWDFYDAASYVETESD